MSVLAIDIIFDAAARHLMQQQGDQAELEKRVLQPQLFQLAGKFERSAQEELGAPIKYRGDMQQGLGRRKEGSGDAVVTQGAAHDPFVRFGTTGPYAGFPMPVKLWAEEKLGLSSEAAGGLAATVMREGTSRFFEGYYPEGGRGFNYPEYVVMQKGLEDVKRAAVDIGTMAVLYVLGKATGQSA